MYVDVPPVHDAVKVMVFPAFWVDGRDGEEVSVGVVSAGLMVNVGEYPDVTVFVPESVTITFVSSGLFDVSVEVVWKV